VFLTLLERSDNGDCKVPNFLTPSLVKLADEIGYSKSATAAALAHLELHGWAGLRRVPVLPVMPGMRVAE
jgi:hypothetical protein